MQDQLHRLQPFRRHDLQPVHARADPQFPLHPHPARLRVHGQGLQGEQRASGVWTVGHSGNPEEYGVAAYVAATGEVQGGSRSASACSVELVYTCVKRSVVCSVTCTLNISSTVFYFSSRIFDLKSITLHSSIFDL